ncbi:MAG: hypothetical protein MUE30_15535 [Spirosomaceae bacterium]|nr:hypothetical protein [Spirosomataceae bacterium]
MKAPIVLLQERDFGQKINATFQFVIDNFKPLMLSLLYIAGPPALIGGFFMSSYQSGILGIQQEVLGGGSTDLAFSGMYSMFTSILFLFLFLGIAGLAATLVVNAYLLEYEEGNRAITPETVWNRMKSYILTSLGYSIVMVLFVGVAALFFILPGIYVSVCLSLMYMVLMRENLDMGDTFRRCFYLIKDKWWSTFGLLVIVGFISGIIGYIFQIPTMAVMISSLLQGKGAEAPSEVWNVISGVIATVGSILVRSLVLVAIGFQYYNLVERRDGAGIINAIEDLGKTEEAREDKREEEF